MLPQLRELERRFPDRLTVIGIHSGKYTTERVSARIAHAARRLGVHHPVLNDRQFRVWRAYAVRAWPTLVAIDHRGQVVGMHAGEFTADAVTAFVQRLLADARAAVPDAALAALPHEAGWKPPAGELAYPDKVAIDGERIAVSDTANHRVLVGTLSSDGLGMRAEREVGGARGYEDGERARFDGPRGLLFHGDSLYVADAGNHAVRSIDLRSGETRTVAGTGRQLRTMADLESGALSSPWDLARIGGTLFVAMAGIHQLWAIDLATGRPRAHSGSRAEDIVDGSHESAALAQPMGIVADERRGRLWFVDAESSAVRWADASEAGEVGTVVGTGLFDFGDTDGRGDDVRLQHPQALVRRADGTLVVADSYNDALKVVDPATRESRTLVRGLHEPGGLALGGSGAVYVADTNAHRIVRVASDGEVQAVRMS